MMTSHLDSGATLARLSDAKRALVNRRLTAAAAALDDESVIPARPHAAWAPLSFSQRQMWIIDQLTPGNPAYNLPKAYRIGGAIDIAALEASFNTVIARHAVLRTTFAAVDGEPRQQVHPALSIAIDVITLDGLTASEREAQLHERARAAAMREFDLSRLPLIAVSVFRLDANEHVVLVNTHHIVSDGLSEGLLFDEIDVCYRAFTAGGMPDLPDLPLQYADYAAWQRDVAAADRSLATQIASWHARLRGVVPTIDLPPDHPRPAVQSFAGSNVFFGIPAPLARALHDLGAPRGCTTFMVLLAAFEVLLRRYSGADEVVVGTPVAARQRDELALLIGNFLNIAPLRCDIAGDPTFLELLQRTRETTIDAISNGVVPLDVILEHLEFTRSPGRNPLFQVMLQVMSVTRPRLGDLEVSHFYFDHGTAQFDLTLHLYEEDDAYVGRFEYCSDLLDAATVERMACNFGHLLRSIVGHAHQPISALDVLDPAERAHLVTGWNETFAGPGADADILVHELVEAQAARTPVRTAVVAGSTVWTYADLAARANRIARALESRGVGPGQRVGLCVERNADMVAALLGVLKSGAAYVPLDPTFPAARLRFLADDARLALLIRSSGLGARVGGVPAERQLLLDSGEPDVPAARTAPRRDSRSTSANAPAYVMYTSGSTGRPKGVVVPHGAVCNLLASMAREPGLSERDVFVAVTTLSFDISVLELLLPLTVGATVVIAAHDDVTDGHRLRGLIEAHRATMMQATPSTWRLVLEAGWPRVGAFKALVGGEALPREVARGLLDAGADVWNMYGPTETTVWSTCGRVSSADERITVGRPIANTSVLVLGARGEIVPVGVPGEACIGGAGVAAGYFDRAARTAERFIPNPVRGARDERVYRTGDLMRWLPDGRLEHLGRIDRQLKIRGLRIEPGEIEGVLMQHEDVERAVVDAHAAGDGEPRLVAYVVLAKDAECTAGELRRHVRLHVPEYMVPGIVMPLAALPMTPNGKVDRRALPDPFANARAARAFEAPQTPTEAAVAAVWQDLLHVERVGREDNFFELGGHSLLALRVAAAVEQRTGKRFDARRLFFQTLSQVADSIAEPRVASWH